MLNHHRRSHCSSMDFDSRVPISLEGTSLSPLLNQNAMWQMNLGSDETMGGDGSYPERPGEPDCSYYIRTGLCRFGSTCRFNHPLDRKLVIATARINGEYPERIGQPECEMSNEGINGGTNDSESSNAPTIHGGNGLPLVAPEIPKISATVLMPEKFDGENFKSWQERMFFLLSNLKLDKYLVEDCPVKFDGENFNL